MKKSADEIANEASTALVDMLLAKKCVTFGFESTRYWQIKRIFEAELKNYADDLNCEGIVVIKDEFYG